MWSLDVLSSENLMLKALGSLPDLFVKCQFGVWVCIYPWICKALASIFREEHPLHHLTAHPEPLRGPHPNSPAAIWLRKTLLLLHHHHHRLPLPHPHLHRLLLRHCLRHSRRRRSPPGWSQKWSKPMRRAARRCQRQRWRKARKARWRSRGKTRPAASSRSSRTPWGLCWWTDEARRAAGRPRRWGQPTINWWSPSATAASVTLDRWVGGMYDWRQRGYHQPTVVCCCSTGMSVGKLHREHV